MESWGIVRTTCPPEEVVPAKPGMRRGGSASTVSRVSTLPCRSAWSVMIVLLVLPRKQSKLRMTAFVRVAPSGPSLPTALSHEVWRTLPSIPDWIVSTLNCQPPVSELASRPPQAATNTIERVALRIGHPRGPQLRSEDQVHEHAGVIGSLGYLARDLREMRERLRSKDPAGRAWTEDARRATPRYSPGPSACTRVESPARAPKVILCR